MGIETWMYYKKRRVSVSLIGKVDVLIIGAGIMGASCAFRLGEQGVKVAVLEAQKGLCRDTCKTRP